MTTLGWGMRSDLPRENADSAARAAILHALYDSEEYQGRKVLPDKWWAAPTMDLFGVPGEAMKRKVSVKREEVLEIIKRVPIPLTTKEVARILRIKEVCVRAAISWLELGGFIKKSGMYVRKYEGRSYKKKIARYVWTGREEAICQVRVKEVDSHEREAINKRWDASALEAALGRMKAKSE